MMNNTGLDNKYQLKNFLEKDGNALAKKEALEVVKNLGLKYNPLYIYGESGSGKTHLLQAIGNKVLENNPEKRVKYISAEDLLENELEIQKVRSEEFDLLIVDDIQILGEKDILIQEKFLNLFKDELAKNPNGVNLSAEQLLDYTIQGLKIYSVLLIVLVVFALLATFLMKKRILSGILFLLLAIVVAVGTVGVLIPVYLFYFIVAIMLFVRKERPEEYQETVSYL